MVDLLFGWFGISCMTTDNFSFYLQNRLIQTGQTGGQQYSNTSPFSIPWIQSHIFLPKSSTKKVTASSLTFKVGILFFQADLNVEVYVDKKTAGSLNSGSDQVRSFENYFLRHLQKRLPLANLFHLA
jgi:hypothetical protein